MTAWATIRRVGTGAVVASMLPWLLTRFGVANEAAPGVIPDSVRLSFYGGAAVFLAAVLWTVTDPQVWKHAAQHATTRARMRGSELQMEPRS